MLEEPAGLHDAIVHRRFRRSLLHRRTIFGTLGIAPWPHAPDAFPFLLSWQGRFLTSVKGALSRRRTFAPRFIEDRVV